jgi:hypothetical protein
MRRAATRLPRTGMFESVRLRKNGESAVGTSSVQGDPAGDEKRRKVAGIIGGENGKIKRVTFRVILTGSRKARASSAGEATGSAPVGGHILAVKRIHRPVKRTLHINTGVEPSRISVFCECIRGMLFVIQTGETGKDHPMKPARSLHVAMLTAIFSALLVSGCYTQFAATEDQAASNDQGPEVLYIPVPYPYPTPIPVLPPAPIRQDPTGGHSHQGPAVAAPQPESPLRDIGHSRDGASQPAVSSPDRATGGNRR